MHKFFPYGLNKSLPLLNHLKLPFSMIRNRYKYKFQKIKYLNLWRNETVKKYILNENDCLVNLTDDSKKDGSALLIALDSPLLMTFIILFII